MVAGSIVLVSTITPPGSSAPSTPSGPLTTASTISGVGGLSTTVCALVAAARGESAAWAPEATARFSVAASTSNPCT